MIRNEVTFFSDLLKPLLLYAVLRNLREASARLFKVIWQSKNMIILLIIYYGLFGWVAFRMYQGTSQGNSIFATREQAIWNMMTVFAGSNFLIKILPSYSSNRFTGILYLGFNILGILFFMNVCIAILYNVYLQQVNERITNFKDTVEDMLKEIFERHSAGDENKLSYSQVERAIRQVITEKTRGEYDRIRIEKIIKVMDKSNKGFVTKAAFLDLFDVLFILLEFEKRKAYIKSRQVVIPQWRQKVYNIYNHKYYEGSMYLLIIFSLLLLFWREYMEIYGIDAHEILLSWIIICVIINFVFFIDLSFRFLYQGFWKPLKSFYALLEIGFQLLSVAATLKYASTLEYGFTISAFEFIILVRLIKILQLLDEIKTWKIILKSLRHLVIPFMSLFMVQLGVIYTYAIIGERIYGGEINYDVIGKLSELGLGKEYVMMNFNDLVSSIITLLYFSLAWTILFKVYLSVIPGIVSMLYTFSFYLFSIL